MPFRECNRMEERIALMKAYDSGLFTVRQLCEQAGVSRETEVAREVAAYEYVPRFPTPVWMCSTPSVSMRTSPSKPDEPAEWNA